MRLLQQIRKDAQQILSNGNEFADSIVFDTPGGAITTTIKGLAVKHHLAVNDIGQQVNSKTARITIPEAALVAANYPVRNTSKEVALKDHKVTWTDSSGTQWKYVIRETYPDEMVGMILCILGDITTIPNPPKKIIAWKAAKVKADIVAVADPNITQTLDNGDIIPLQYVLNNDGTLTIPYIATMSVLTPFMINSRPVQAMPYVLSTGTFNNAGHGGFNVGNKIEFNAVIPFYLQ